MKKLSVIALSLLCLFFVLTVVGCKDDIIEENNPTSENVLINGFNSWDDMIIFDLNPTSFIGNWEINKDKDYIVEGESSYKIYVEKTGANQPNFKMEAKNVKTDITDIEEFGLYIYNCADYEFEVIITAFAADDVVCAPLQRVKSGVNNLTFPINRGVIQQNGKVITDYSISFSGIKGGTTIYIDNLYVKTTTDPIVINKEVKDIIDAINALSNQPKREDIETVLEKYNALSTEDKMCVTNVSRLRASMQPFWISDLARAKEEDCETLLYFDMPFAEVQVESVTPGISSYYYTTEVRHGDEQGSLKVDFTTSSTNWVSLMTSATTLIEEKNIEFYVYNDSDQVKAMCVGWNAPLDPVIEDYFYVLEPKVWTKIYCKSTDLTNSGGSSGGIEICGLQSRTEGGSCAPRDTVYFSSVVKRDVALSVKRARQGEDTNTLYLFDNELGLNQISLDQKEHKTSIDNAELEISTDKKHLTDTGSLAIKINDFEIKQGRGFPIYWWDTFDYEINDSDYIVFYAYNDTASDIIDISLNTTHRERLHNGEWTTVIWKGSDVKKAGNNWSWLFAYNYSSEEFGPLTGCHINGTIYISKVKVFNKDQVVDLSEVEDTFEYTIGHTTLKGKSDDSESGGYNPNDQAFNDSDFTHAFLIDGKLRFHGRASNNAVEFSPKTGFVFKQTYAVKDCYMYVTVKGAVDGEVYAQIFNAQGITGAGHIDTPKGTLVETLEDGFAVYKFDISAYRNRATALSGLKAFRLAVKTLKKPYIVEIIVSDIEIKYEHIEQPEDIRKDEGYDVGKDAIKWEDEVIYDRSKDEEFDVERDTAEWQ